MRASTTDILIAFGVVVVAVGGLILANRLRIARWNARAIRELPYPRSLKNAAERKATPAQMTLVGIGGCMIGVILLAAAARSAVETLWSPSGNSAVVIVVICVQLLAGMLLLVRRRAKRGESHSVSSRSELLWSAVALLTAAATGVSALFVCVVVAATTAGRS